MNQEHENSIPSTTPVTRREFVSTLLVGAVFPSRVLGEVMSLEKAPTDELSPLLKWGVTNLGPAAPHMWPSMRCDYGLPEYFQFNRCTMAASLKAHYQGLLEGVESLPAESKAVLAGFDATMRLAGCSSEGDSPLVTEALRAIVSQCENLTGSGLESGLIDRKDDPPFYDRFQTLIELYIRLRIFTDELRPSQWQPSTYEQNRQIEEWAKTEVKRLKELIVLPSWDEPETPKQEFVKQFPHVMTLAHLQTQRTNVDLMLEYVRYLEDKDPNPADYPNVVDSYDGGRRCSVRDSPTSEQYLPSLAYEATITLRNQLLNAIKEERSLARGTVTAVPNLSASDHR